jgi:hypothetical protein
MIVYETTERNNCDGDSVKWGRGVELLFVVDIERLVW